MIRYYRAQAPSCKSEAPTLLFLHGWGSEGAVWRGVCEKLAHCGYHMYALDLSGFGASETPKNPYSLDDYARSVFKFIQTLKLKKIILVGHSFGGSVAIKLAATHPKIIQKLILVSSSGIRKMTAKKRAVGFIAKCVKPFFRSRYMQPFRKKLYILIGAEDYTATPKLTETFRLIVNEDLALILPKITQKTLIIWGDKDRATPLKDAYIFEHLIQNSALVVLKGAGHYSFLDKQDEWIEAVERFI
ncbi:MAG: hypothetical protein A2249_02475 [Candidatus Jacksonbacteria bacterium RIFOXYA2_FULL_44_7]|uniref:AB hydrolase-1 domain-containing protein n=1 Tax=Candidatus Jacksonbacteria bacterium RIFCSPLOWO2_02_FULL_44_20 TaxID=1798460 RepID=A0A1G2A7Z1_9BACT|nr:MAG: hypothetical protein A3C00_03190 [Candidatus Jacksonbacteria bacterium RIFCSPHIGHO2_02_FULL_44_25]OGY73008.1 MAG: hypothetical protein A3H61_04215 [Candidatus Jacksonbacteria bacterium RIFCSPLOWO2_02_FULL_44_20]OGY77121.1 MAG: hypothetical protein A2249_02475 [Candidatus Jacksonbacteria bacterium RIFOXYA2_FULL_44_7]